MLTNNLHDLSSQVQDSIKWVIQNLYPDHKKDVLDGIVNTVNKYENFTKKENKNALSENDVILIAYADAIQQQKTKSHLKTFNRFANQYLNEVVSGVHFLPFFPYTSDDGFSVVDYYAVAPELGHWQDVETISKNFDLMFDAVVNHSSKSCEWFQKFLQKEHPYAEYYTVADPNEDYSLVTRPRALPLFHAYDSVSGKIHVWTTFSEDQVDLNYASHHVFIQVLDILLFYASKGARFIRLDAVAFLFKKLGTNCIHLEETHKIIQAYRSIFDLLKIDIIIITETNVPHSENISYFGNGNNEAHMVYNFTLPPLLAYSVLKNQVTDLTQWAKQLELPSKSTCFFNFTASHDGIGVRPLQGILPESEIAFLANNALAHGGFVSYKDNGDGTKSPYELNCNYLELLSNPRDAKDTRIGRFMLTQSVMLCMPGVPGIYYHSLLGSLNDIDGVKRSGINRRINREKLDFNHLEETLSTPGSIRNIVYSQYVNLLKIRKKETVFNPYGEARYHQQGSVFIIERMYEDETLFAVHNFSDKAVSIKSYVSKGKDLLTGKLVETIDWNVNAYGFLWIKKCTAV